MSQATSSPAGGLAGLVPSVSIHKPHTGLPRYRQFLHPIIGIEVALVVGNSTRLSIHSTAQPEIPAKLPSPNSRESVKSAL